MRTFAGLNLRAGGDEGARRTGGARATAIGRVLTALLLGALAWGASGCGGKTASTPLEAPAAAKTPAEMVAAVEATRLQTDLAWIARGRVPGSAHHGAVADLCAQRFEALGYQVERQDFGAGTNVLGTLQGAVQPEQQVVVSAHYDSTSETCDGADDNASGVAGVLEAARVLAMATHDRTLVVACWDREETGLQGSISWVGRAHKQNQPVVMGYVYEMIGYASDQPKSQKVPAGFDQLFPEQVAWIDGRERRGDFIGLIRDAHPNAAVAAAAMTATAQQVGLPLLDIPVPDGLKNSPLAVDLRRSDHAAFWLKNDPAMMITDTANFRNSHYHCSGGPDSADRLDMAFAAKVVQATVGGAIASLAAPATP